MLGRRGTYHGLDRGGIMQLGRVVKRGVDWHSCSHSNCASRFEWADVQDLIRGICRIPERELLWS